jgi:hypothetical protein
MSNNKVKCNYNDYFKTLIENGLEIIEEPDKKITAHIRIKAKCMTNNCVNIFDKKLRYIKEGGGAFCTECVQINKTKKFKETRGNGYKDYLIKLINNGLKLINEVIIDNVTRYTHIQALCTNENCNNKFEKIMYSIKHSGGALCDKCTQKARVLKMKSLYRDFFIKLIKKGLELVENIDKNDINVYSSIKAVCMNTDCSNLFEKKMRYIKNKGGPYCISCTKKNTLLKIKEIVGNIHKEYLINLINNNGLEIDKNINIDDVNQQTLITGLCINVNCKNIFTKLMKSVMEDGGPLCVTCCQKNATIKNIETCISKYGVPNVKQHPEFQLKFMETCLTKYGTPHPMQNADVLEKTMNNAFKFKDYILPSGKIIKYQGYENWALDELLKEGFEEDDIKNSLKDVPEIWYKDNDGREHRYYTDIYIESINKCIEVKSTWTYTADEERVLRKHEAASEEYLSEIWVYDKNGTKVKTIL